MYRHISASIPSVPWKVHCTLLLHDMTYSVLLFNSPQDIGTTVLFRQLGSQAGTMNKEIIVLNCLLISNFSAFQAKKETKSPKQTNKTPDT